MKSITASMRGAMITRFNPAPTRVRLNNKLDAFTTK